MFFLFLLGNFEALKTLSKIEGGAVLEGCHWNAATQSRRYILRKLSDGDAEFLAKNNISEGVFLTPADISRLFKKGEWLTGQVSVFFED